MHAVGVPRPRRLPIALRVAPIQRRQLQVHEFKIIVAFALRVFAAEAVDALKFRLIFLGEVDLSVLDGEVIGCSGFSAVVDGGAHGVEGDSFFQAAGPLRAVDLIIITNPYFFSINQMILVPLLLMQMIRPEVLQKPPIKNDPSINHQQLPDNTCRMASPWPWAFSNRFLE